MKTVRAKQSGYDKNGIIVEKSYPKKEVRSGILC